MKRWDHPSRGMLLPSSFVPIAEDTGLIVPMTRWLVNHAAKTAMSWYRRGFDLPLGVNLSARHFSSGSLVDDILRALDETGMPADHLVVELTETAVAGDRHGAAQQLAELRQVGVLVAIDDFGSGASSLGQLSELPADIVKIDRLLIDNLSIPSRQRTATAVLRAVVAVCAALGMRTVGEGVETQDQLDIITEIGIDMAQGYFLAPPIAAAEL